MKKLLLAVTLLILIPGVSAVSINLTIDPPQTNGFYTSNFDATATANETNASVSLYFNGSEFNNGTGSVTASIPTSNTEGTYTIEATAEFNGSSDTEPNSSIKIDTKDPRLPEDLSPSEVFNATEVGHNESFEISLEVNDTFLDYVRAGQDSDIENNNVNLSESGGVWTVQTTPNELGCEANTSCEIRIEAFDEADNSDWFTKTIQVEGDNQSFSKQGFHINITSPANESVQDDSVFPFDVVIDSDGEGLSRCNFILNTQQGSFYKGGNFPQSDFEKNGTIYVLEEKRLENITDGDYKLDLVCTRGDEEKDYEESSSFVVVDTTPPSLNMDFSFVTNSSANVTINSSEAFRLDSLDYKVLGGSNATSVSHPSNVFLNEFSFGLTNLSPGTEYVIQATGTDWAEDKDSTDFLSTGTFETEGGVVNETEEKSIEEVAVEGRNFTNENLKGLNYSHGLSWIRTDEPSEISVTNFDMNIRELMISVREDIRNVHLTLTTSNETPSWLNKGKPSNSSVFEYYQIEAENAPDSKIKWVKIRFEVNNMWLQEKGISKDNIALYRYKGDSWEQLPTSLEEEGALLHTYESLTSGFSMFAVAAEKEEKGSVDAAVQQIETTEQERESNESMSVNKTGQMQTQESSEEDEGLPWYWWVIGVLLLVMLGVLSYYVSISISPESEDLDDHKVVKAHMQRLEEFVDEALKKGYSKEDLRKRLVDSGWDKKLVEFVLRRK